MSDFYDIANVRVTGAWVAIGLRSLSATRGRPFDEKANTLQQALAAHGVTDWKVCAAVHARLEAAASLDIEKAVAGWKMPGAREKLLQAIADAPLNENAHFDAQDFLTTLFELTEGHWA